MISTGNGGDSLEGLDHSIIEIDEDEVPEVESQKRKTLTCMFALNPEVDEDTLERMAVQMVIDLQGAELEWKTKNVVVEGQAQ